VTAALGFRAVDKRYRVYTHRNRSLKDIVLERRIGVWEDRWALRDVSFEIERGSSFGLIGPNGAGKSTALKLIARILLPDSGRVESAGRVGALIELGAGFHPDSTGRENVLLNASLLGMSDAQIKRQMDPIVEFAGLAEVIDQPLRTYSSGMQLRLGFAVAIHTEPDILLLDEILAVGDEAFQTKCFDHIRRFKARGGTIVFVSHSMDSVREVCGEAAWIEGGRVREMGSADSVIGSYLTQVHESLDRQSHDATSGASIEIGEVRLIGSGGPSESFESGEDLLVEIPLLRRRTVPDPILGVALHRSDGVSVYATNTRLDHISLDAMPERATIRFVLPELSLLNGAYRVSVGVYSMSGMLPVDFHDQRYQFRVRSHDGSHGLVRLKHRWQSWEEE